MLSPLEALAHRLGVQTRYVDGLGHEVDVAPETLGAVCAALGAELVRPDDAATALATLEARAAVGALPEVVVAWDGRLPALPVSEQPGQWRLELEGGEEMPLTWTGFALESRTTLPLGYHQLRVDTHGTLAEVTIIAAPVEAYRRGRVERSWGLGAHLAALRSTRSRAVGDLADLETLCDWVVRQGGDLVAVLPLLPVFSDPDPEPSPYSPVSRLFWSELILDLGDSHQPVTVDGALDITRAAAEVRAALGDRAMPDPGEVDDELLRYARFRGAQRRLGRDWRRWPEPLRRGALPDDAVDTDEARLHLVAQLDSRRQLSGLRTRLDARGMRLGLDLAVGVHPDGYDTWSRQGLFAESMSVGAPPDPGFPSGQDWGFRPMLPGASRAEGHRYFAASLRHQMSVAGVLRLDHVMALRRLYWIPRGMRLDQGTYVQYPADELFAIATLESYRHRCELVGENLGTVPETMQAALARHRIAGMYVAQFAAHDPTPRAPARDEVAFVGTHDTPTFAGWIAGTDLPHRVEHGLLPEADAASSEREAAVRRLAEMLDVPPDDPAQFLDALLTWLGSSASPLVMAWLEDLWLEPRGVNLPGTTSAAHPNWQRPLAAPLDRLLADPAVIARAQVLSEARRR